MCEFCKNINSGDNFEPILSKILDLGILGDFMIDVYLRSDSEGNAAIVMEGCSSYGNKECEAVVTKINYCPICGHNFA